jgi:hypothetical protein
MKEKEVIKKVMLQLSTLSLFPDMYAQIRQKCIYHQQIDVASLMS